MINYNVDKETLFLDCTPVWIAEKDTSFSNENLLGVAKEHFNSILPEVSRRPAGVVSGGTSYSKGNFFEYYKGHEEVSKFENWLHEQFKGYYQLIEDTSPGKGLEEFKIGLEGWIIVMKDGDYFPYHNHSSLVDTSLLSWVYYIDPGECNKNVLDNGFLQLIFNPVLSQIADSNDFKFEPKKGNLIVFPSDIYHMVLPYVGKKHRWAIAGNLHGFTTEEMTKGDL